MNAAGRKAVSLTSVFILLAFVFLFTTAYYAAVPLICFAVLPGSLGSLGVSARRRLEYTVESEGRSEKEKPLVFFVTVKNSGVLPVFSVSITVVLRNKFTEEERRERIITAVGPRAKKTVKMMTEEKHCGCVEASIEEAYISDPLGISEEREPRRPAAVQIYFPPKERRQQTAEYSAVSIRKVLSIQSTVKATTREKYKGFAITG